MSLEEPFWQAFREIAEERGRAINDLAAEIDADRGLETGLATAIRLFVLDHYRLVATRVNKADTAST